MFTDTAIAFNDKRYTSDIIDSWCFTQVHTHLRSNRVSYAWSGAVARDFNLALSEEVTAKLSSWFKTNVRSNLVSMAVTHAMQERHGILYV